MTFTILFLIPSITRFGLPDFQANLYLSYKTKKEPATETNPQQALGLMKLYNVLSS